MAFPKTPGVYVERVSQFAPSLTPLATAIPAFIGYTEKATELIDGDLKLVPKRIVSMQEYEQYFGFAQNETSIIVTVTNDNNLEVQNNTPSDYVLYYSLQMYFANGGGPCYIVSSGSYSDPITLQDNTDPLNTFGLNYGLTEVRKEDEVTLLLFPDAQGLSESDFNALNQAALTQCAELQDRFAILDTYGDSDTAINNFRNGIGVDNLKYGACYFPFLDTTLDFQYAESDVTILDNTAPTPAERVSAINDRISTQAFLDILLELDAIRVSVNNLPAAEALKQIPALVDVINKLFSYWKDIENNVYEAATIGEEYTSTTSLEAWVTFFVDPILSGIEAFVPRARAITTKTALANLISDNTPSNPTDSMYEFFGINESGNDVTTSSFLIFIGLIKTTEFEPIIAALAGETVTTYNLGELKRINNDLYNRIVAEIADYPVTLPPSSAMAGIYARVDNENGVWTAPANVPVENIQKPTQLISNERQEEMNVSSTGKSVNAIRTFTGKGTLVWGARTLAGNDNEWRYIPVRRLFNFVEESISEATEQFVFEPNVAITWVRLRTLIENFLTDIWKLGALNGASEREAFFVRVGLGQTMTSEDILDGRMVVEIGLAAVRPAEFITLQLIVRTQQS